MKLHVIHIDVIIEEITHIQYYYVQKWLGLSLKYHLRY